MDYNNGTNTDPAHRFKQAECVKNDRVDHIHKIPINTIQLQKHVLRTKYMTINLTACISNKFLPTVY
jgi:hypothetical protein